MKNINLAISGCMGRMGQQLINSSKKNKNFSLLLFTNSFLSIRTKKGNKIKNAKNTLKSDRRNGPNSSMATLKNKKDDPQIAESKIKAKKTKSKYPNAR